jgi:hypothetical protein
MEPLSEKKVINMFFECLFREHYVSTLNNYELELIYGYAVDYFHKINKPRFDAVRLQKGNGLPLNLPPKHELDERVGELVKELELRLFGETPQQTETKTEQETPTFENNFDNIATVEIYKHFKVGLVTICSPILNVNSLQSGEIYELRAT